MLGHSLTFMSSKWKTGYLFYQLPSTFVLEETRHHNVPIFLSITLRESLCFLASEFYLKCRWQSCISGWVNPHTGKGLLDSISQYTYLKNTFAKKKIIFEIQKKNQNQKTNNRNRKWILIRSKKWILKLVWIYNQI